MCQYIKENGEQCGRDAEPYCFQHEGADGAQSDSSDEDDPSVCQVCGTAVRRCVTSVEEAQFAPRMVTIEEAFVCDCGEYVIGAKNVPQQSVPDGWY